MNPLLKRDEPLKHYYRQTTEGLEFCFKYLNFYIGLLSVLTAASITAVFQFKAPYPLGLLLLVGPTLVVSLAILGYKNGASFLPATYRGVDREPKRRCDAGAAKRA